MGSYYMDDPRRYSGYDEYAGIFGPLQASTSYGSRAQRRWPSSRRGFADSRGLAKTNKGRRRPPRSFERRAKFLADRKTKRGLQSPLDVDSDGNDDLHEQGLQSASPTRGLQRQVWLPTRNFSFRQRAGKLDTRAIARLDLEKIAATTDVETIQRHLENLAFSDVTLDDVQHYSDTYFLKLFQIAQLTLEYLMHVQDSLVDHSEVLEKQCDQLLTECQQLETENGQREAEIASLKREIRQKQRTMATLELMLLNASASTRINSSAKENAASEANALVEELLTKRSDPTTTEEGSIVNPVKCVLCSKRFVSAEYLLRHQERRHHEAKTKKKKSVKSSSGSDSDSEDKKKKKTPKPAPLPKEVIDALEEKNQLEKQLVALQDQVRAEQEARDRQRQQIEIHQNHMNSRMENYMEKLQSTLVEIEKKQEATKHDLRQYTQESIARLQVEAANAELLRIQQQKSSRAGRLENDDDSRAQAEAASRLSEDAKWTEKVEKLMDTFLRAQAQKQQEIDTLEQESNKLWTKYNKLKKRKLHRPEPIMTLTDLTALDADRFGVDRGEVVEAPTPIQMKSPASTALLEDKIIQTDDENEGKRAPTVVARIQEFQTPAEEKVIPPPIVVPPLRVDVIDHKTPPPTVEQPLPRKEEVAVVPPVTILETTPKQTDTKARLQKAAQMIGKVALGFLTRQALAKSSNWRITIAIASLESALTAEELEYLHAYYDDALHVQVDEAMTANDLRVLIAKALSGKDEFDTAGNATDPDKESATITTTMTYHRVLLHHKHTGAELCGDTLLVHAFKNAIEVEIIPYHEPAATQIGEVLDFHAKMSDRILDIKRASLELSASNLPILKQSSSEERKLTLVRLERLQAIVRGFLAKKKVELMKIDRLVDARLVKVAEESAIDPKSLEPSWMSLDPVLAAEYEKIQQKLAKVLRAKLGLDDERGSGAADDIDEDSSKIISSPVYEKHVAELDAEQKNLPANVRHCIQLITERLGPIAAGEYRRKDFDFRLRATGRVGGAAAKIHRAVQVEIVRKRLKRLLAGDHTIEGKRASQPAAMTALLSSWLEQSKERQHTTSLDKMVESFDKSEIDRLANAYEEGNSPVELPRLKLADEKKPALLTLSEDSKPKDDEQSDDAEIVRPLTPRAELIDDEPSPRPRDENTVADPGRSPRPDPGVHVISPFSKTPLISRRAGAATRRGMGYYNAR